MFARTKYRRNSDTRKADFDGDDTWKARRRGVVPRKLSRGFILRVLAVLVLLWSLIDAQVVHSRYAVRSTPARRVDQSQERLFIASIHWNNEEILRSHWNKAVLDLVRTYGRNNTYVSIQESGSWDNSKDALKELGSQLEAEHFRHKLILDATTHADEIAKTPSATGWIKTPRNKVELRRIPYLSRLRNLVLEPLQELAEVGIKFDKIVFLNDVIFTTRDIEVLLSTRGGDFAAVCSLDFSKPPGFYDTFALRDSHGYNKLTKTWPYFRSGASRAAMKLKEPVPVASCWNGIAIMDAQPFYNAREPLRFRGVADSLAEHHIEGSECCLIHADNPLTPAKGVWLHPDVRVAYNPAADMVVNGNTGSWLSFWTIYRGLWENRLRRWFTTPYFQDAIVHRRLRRWQSQSSENIEPGKPCLVNELQVLVANGWAHV